MIMTNRLAPVVFALVATCGIAAKSHAATVLSIGQPQLDSGARVVTAPVYLELDKNGSEPIQGIAFSVKYAPAAAVKSIRIVRGGITQDLVPSFEATPHFRNTISYLAMFPESGGMIPFANTAMVKDQVATIEITLHEDADLAVPLELALDGKKSAVTNARGTEPQSVDSGTLEIAPAVSTADGPVR